MLTSEVVVIVNNIVKVDKVSNTNNKIMIDIENDSDGNRKETLF